MPGLWEEFRLNNLLSGYDGSESLFRGKSLGWTIFYLDLNPGSVGRD
jgi:hypothetical protein